MKYAYLLTVLFSLSAKAQVPDLTFDVTGGSHYVQTQSHDNLVLQTGSADENGFGGGLNLLSGNSVQIQSGGDGSFTLNSANTSSIDISAGGSVVLYAGPTYPVYTFAESLQVYTDHGLQLTAMDSQPTCDSGRRGTLYYVQAGTGVADTLEICMKLADESYAWHVVP